MVCVGAAQCTLCRGPWSSTGPVPWYGVDVPVVVQQHVLWLTLLAHAWLDSGYIFCVYMGAFWTHFTQFLCEGGTLIRKSIVHPALPSLSGEVCTVDASVADELFRMEIRTFFPTSPFVFCRILSCPQAPLVEFLEPSTTKRYSSSTPPPPDTCTQAWLFPE